MEIILHNAHKPIILCFVVCWTFTAEPMDPPGSRSGSPINLQLSKGTWQKKINIWNNQELVKTGVTCAAVVPGSLIITPDEEGVLFTQPGKVLYCHRNLMLDCSPFEVVTHSHAKFHPLIAAAIKGDEKNKKKLLIASILNNRSRKSKIPKCEVVLTYLTAKKPPYESHDVFSKRVVEFVNINMANAAVGNLLEYSVSNIQAVELHNSGKLLILAFRDHLRMIDLKTKVVSKNFFMPRLQDSCRIIDASRPIDISSRDSTQQYVVAISNEGKINLKKYSQEYDSPMFSNMKSVDLCDPAEKIIMASNHDLFLLLANSKGEVKIVKFTDLIENDEGCVKSHTICHGKGDKVALDGSNGCDSIHWYSPENGSHVDCSILNVYREGSSSKDEISIAVPNLPEQYVLINEKGQEVMAKSCVLQAALCGTCVAAVTTEGDLHLGSLPSMYKAPTAENVRNPDQTLEPNRRRSLSYPAQDLIKKYAQTIPDKVSNEKRRSVGKRGENVPKLNFVRSSKESLIKGTTRETRGSASPSGSPRKANSKEKTPRTRKSMPPACDKRSDLGVIISSDELKKLNLEQQDMMNDIKRAREMDS